jgi:hypothetical protein
MSTALPKTAKDVQRPKPSLDSASTVSPNPAVIREHLIILREINAAEPLIEIAEELARAATKK